MWKNKEYYYLLFKDELNKSFGQNYWLSTRYFTQSYTNGDFGLCIINVNSVSAFQVFGGWLYQISRRQ